MLKPRIRHLAIVARDPDRLAKFYVDVFGMELIGSKGPGKSHYVTDGHLTLAILPHRLDGSAPVGLNHFGFSVDDTATVSAKLVEQGVVAPQQRPADRAFAELRGVDPEGNWFDLSQNGYEEARPEAPVHRVARN